MMSIRRAMPVLLLLLAAALASTPAAAQAAASRQERALARQWATVRADSAAVDRLFQATVHAGGPVLFDAVLAAARDERRPPLVRVYALAALTAYARSSAGIRASAFLVAARDAEIGCVTSLAWAPGDTLRTCARFRVRHSPPAVAPSPVALAVDSARKESLVAAASELARGRGAVAGAADLLLWVASGGLWPASLCPRERPLLAAGDTAARERDRVYSVAEVTQAPTLHNACSVSLRVVRHYPPLARDAGEGGMAVLSVVVDPGGDVREAVVERAGPRPEFGAAALAAVGYMRFIPARRDGARVSVRVSIPIHFAVSGGGGYPRVARPLFTSFDE
jgi:TonB family protein